MSIVGQLASNVSMAQQGSASAVFLGVNVRAPIGATVELRAVCTTEYGEVLPALKTPELTLIAVLQPKWRVKPPPYVLPSQRAALNVFGEEYICGSDGGQNASNSDNNSSNSNSSTASTSTVGRCAFPSLELFMIDALDGNDSLAVVDFDTVSRFAKPLSLIPCILARLAGLTPLEMVTRY